MIRGNLNQSQLKAMRARLAAADLNPKQRQRLLWRIAKLGIIVAAIGALALLWYLNRDDEDVQALTENFVGKLNRGVSGTREAITGLYGRLRARTVTVG